MRFSYASLLPITAVLAYAACSSSSGDGTADGGATSTSSSGVTSSSGDGGGSTSSGDGGSSGTVNPIPTTMGTVALDLTAESANLFLDGAQWMNNALYYSIPDGNQLRKTTDTVNAVSTTTGGIVGLAYKGTVAYGAQAPAAAGGKVVSFDPTAAAPVFANLAPSAGITPDSPNDIAVRPVSGELWVTDPGYQKGTGTENRIYRIAGTTWTVAATYGTEDPKPNGIAFTKDGNTLYVSFTALKRISKFTVNAAGALDSPMGTAFATYTTEDSLDGLAVDNDGNVYAATSTGVDVYKSGGTKWGTIAIPKAVSMTFGGADGKTLYITTGAAKIYTVPLAVAGPLSN